jgi:amidophosphoribosyltransferase
MSETLTHECGIALLRIKNPAILKENPQYALLKMYLLMEKMHNRGQDGAGIAAFNLSSSPGEPFIQRVRSVKSQPIKAVFNEIRERMHEGTINAKPFNGEIFLGHLRYGTFGANGMESCHPFVRESNWKSKHLTLAGNFNLTNVHELFNRLLQLGQHPREKADTVTVMERIGHFLDEEIQRHYLKLKNQGLSKAEISEQIPNQYQLTNILSKAAGKFDGGFVIAGIIGHGDCFALRDAHGIRPAFYYDDENLTIVASEKPVIQTVFGFPAKSISEIPPGNALICNRFGITSLNPVLPKAEHKQCSFERIYFSRGSDADIYNERKQLGRELANQLWPQLQNNLHNTVFSYIPNTAETAFLGLVNQLEKKLAESKIAAIQNLPPNNIQALADIVNQGLRIEKVAIKDVKLRTFITEEGSRSDLIQHVYDITYGSIRPQQDSLVVIDDSIVRGSTLKSSILQMLGRLNPAHIHILSSAPQIRYPDCYGIDMARLDDLSAFRAAVELHLEKDKGKELQNIELAIEEELQKPLNQMHNLVREVYKPFSAEQISLKMAEMLRPEAFNIPVSIHFQSLEGLQSAIPNHTGNWYFSGNYPTPGGNRVANLAYLQFRKGNRTRAY